MRFEILKRAIATAVCSLAVAMTAMGEEGHEDIEIGRTAGNQLAFVAVPDEPILLDIDTAFAWSAAEPGLFEITGPEDGFLPLDTFSNTDIRLELISADAGFVFFSAGNPTPMNTPGDFASLGLEGGLVHSHPTWAIDKTVVGNGFEGTLSATFRLVDGATSGYAISENVTLDFTNVPEPGSAVALLLGAGLIATRRRRK